MNASSTDATYPFFTIAWAICALPVFKSVAPSFCDSILSTDISIPCLFTSSSTFLLRTSLAFFSSSSFSASSVSFSSINKPTMCISFSYFALISTPDIPSIPYSPQARLNSASPFIVSWSVSATALSPVLCALCATSDGVNVPSDAVECVCKSIFFIIDKSLQFCHKRIYVIKTFVYRRKTYISNFIKFFKFFHNLFTDSGAFDFTRH